jgi:hypothetical protein
MFSRTYSVAIVTVVEYIFLHKLAVWEAHRCFPNKWMR